MTPELVIIKLDKSLVVGVVVNGAGITIERKMGIQQFRNPDTGFVWNHTIINERYYNPSYASKQRFCRVVSRMVNNHFSYSQRPAIKLLPNGWEVEW